MSAGKAFFDTNVLLYADDKAAPAKQSRALALVAEHRRAGTGVVSMQVLQEYFVAVTRKLRLLRAHGLIKKVPKTHRWVLTDRGTETITTLLAARSADAQQLLKAA